MSFILKTDSKELSINLKYVICLTILLNIFFRFKGFSQTDFFYDAFTNSIERIYLHTDKTFYNSGDDIWFKAYLVDASTLTPGTLSKVAYVDLLNPSGEILITKTLHINDGYGRGDFKLPVRLPRGQYTLRAYTTYMRNFDKAFFFRKKINIS